MKKLICMLLIAALCCAITPALAEEIGALGDVTITPSAEKGLSLDFEGEAPERSTGDELIAKTDDIKAAEDDVTRAGTTDTVTISGNQYTVATPYNVTFNYTAPAGTYVLTQDYVQQAALFAQFYNDPQAAYNSFVQSKVHLNMYDPNTRTDVYLRVCDTPLAQQFPNANMLTVDQATSIVEFMFTRPEYFLNCTEAVFGWAGGNVWFVGDARSTTGEIVLSTFVNGHEVWENVKANSDAQYDKVIEMLNCLTIS